MFNVENSFFLFSLSGIYFLSEIYFILYVYRLSVIWIFVIVSLNYTNGFIHFIVISVCNCFNPEFIVRLMQGWKIWFFKLLVFYGF